MYEQHCRRDISLSILMTDTVNTIFMSNVHICFMMLHVTVGATDILAALNLARQAKCVHKSQVHTFVRVLQGAAPFHIFSFPNIFLRVLTPEIHRCELRTFTAAQSN